MQRALGLGLMLALAGGCVHHHRGYGSCHRGASGVEGLIFLGALGLALAAESTPPAPQPVVYQPAPPPPEQRPVALEGWVVADTGVGAIPFTVVSITGGQGVLLRKLTDQGGGFRIEQPLPAGRYRLEVIDRRWVGAVEIELAEGAVPVIVIRARPPG